MDILFEKGIRTRERPAIEISEVKRGPFVEMALWLLGLKFLALILRFLQ